MFHRKSEKNVEYIRSSIDFNHVMSFLKLAVFALRGYIGVRDFSTLWNWPRWLWHCGHWCDPGVTAQWRSHPSTHGWRVNIISETRPSA